MPDFLRDLNDETKTASVADQYFHSPENQARYPVSYTIFKYWDNLRDGHFAPQYSRFNLTDLPYQILPSCAVADVHPEPLDFVYRYWGSRSAESTGQEMTGKSVWDFKYPAMASSVFERLKWIVENHSSLVIISDFGRQIGIDTTELVMRLPMSSNGVDVDVILTTVDVPQIQRDALASYVSKIKI